MFEVFNRVKLTISPENDNPFLHGPYAPLAEEVAVTGDDLKVTGDIPRDLNGIYVRNAHNQVHESIGMYHPFDGDGMLHAIAFEDGKAEYRNRFVRTTGWYAEQAAGRRAVARPDGPARVRPPRLGSIGAMKDNAGTDVFCHAGKLLATMSQCSEPYRLDPRSLETLGPTPPGAAPSSPRAPARTSRCVPSPAR
jgi:carotenoid cleavage dioxygenase